MSENTRIAKNTGFLYLRMLVVMAVQLITSRVVLQVLGVVDYGLYNVVGGVVVMLSFLNGCAAGATSRYLTFSLGSDKYDYKRVFGASFTIHTLIAILIVILGETVGLWYVYNKMVIPPDRLNAALWVYHISIINVLVSFTQVPYNASIIAHERMKVYAFVGLYEAFGKLGVTYLLFISPIDKLEAYAILLFLLTLSISIFYRLYCVKVFGDKCKLSVVRDKKLYKELLSYSGWDLVGNFGSVARSQGVNLILNLFFGPAVNSARAFAYQVETALYGFISNFLQAIRPNVIRHYAAGEIDRTNSLLFLTGRFSFILFSCFAIPLILECDYVMNLWLVNPPEYTVLFTQIVLIIALVTTINNTLQMAAHACGDVKRLNIFAGSKVFVEIPLVYLVLKWGASPEWALIILLIGTTLINAANLYVVHKNIPEFSVKDFCTGVILRDFLIILVPTACAYLVHIIHFNHGFVRVVIVTAVYLVILAPLALQLGMSKEQRKRIFAFAQDKLHIKHPSKE